MNKLKQGKRNKINGAAFERRVRKDLESKGWIVTKWMNNVEFDDIPISVSPNLLVKRMVKCIPAKRKYNPFNRAFSVGTGFPDFIVYSWSVKGSYQIMFVEVKTNGMLDKQEKEKARWYLDNNYCSKFLIAKKTKVKNKIVIEYEEFQ